MIGEYFLQFGIILFPLWIYQIWTFHKSFQQLPAKTLFMGIYGGGAALVVESIPVHLFGVQENFECVPIILACLYGKRRAGALAIGIVVIYQVSTIHLQAAAVSALAILIYSALPLVFCNRYEKYSKSQRLLLSGLLSLLTLVVEYIFIIFLVALSGHKLSMLIHYLKFLGSASAIQFVLMWLAAIVLENIITDGRVRRNLEESEQRYKSLIENNPYGVCGIDRNNNFFIVNRAYEEMVGYSAEELIGTSRFRLWAPEDRAFGEHLMGGVLSGVVERDIEIDILHKSGRRIHVSATKFPIVVEQKIVGYYSIVSDITHVKMIEETVIKSEKLAAVGQLAVGVAHEIRNPLTSVMGFLNLLPAASPDQQEKYREIMRCELSRIEGIISEMLVLAKPHAVHYRLVNTHEMLEEVQYLLSAEANLHGVSIQMNYDDQPSELIGERNQLKQVFASIGKNAIEAMEDGGTLTITMKHEHENLIVEFSDQGHGIPEDLIDKVGEPFYSTKPNGTGLGLLVSRHIMRNHGGSVEIHSTPDVGTTVSLHFPLPIAPETSTETEELISEAAR